MRSWMRLHIAESTFCKVEEGQCYATPSFDGCVLPISYTVEVDPNKIYFRTNALLNHSVESH